MPPIAPLGRETVRLTGLGRFHLVTRRGDVVSTLWGSVQITGKRLTDEQVRTVTYAAWRGGFFTADLIPAAVKFMRSRPELFRFSESTVEWCGPPIGEPLPLEGGA